MDQGNYLSQPFNTLTKYPNSFDEFKNSQIGKSRIEEIPSRVKETHLKIWGDINMDMDFLTTPLSDSIKVAAMLYVLQPYLNAHPHALQEKADLHHAFVRLAELWTRFEDVLYSWAKTEIGAHADAADGLSCLEQARFMPVLKRFVEVMQGYGEQPDLFNDLEEFVTTSMRLTQNIEIWLAIQNSW